MKVRPILIGLVAFVLAGFVLLNTLFSSYNNPLDRVKSNTPFLPTALAVNPTRAVSRAAAPAKQAAVIETAAPIEATDSAAIPQPMPPSNPSGAFQQGLTLRRNGDYPRAATVFRTVVQSDADPALAREAQFRLGESLYLASDFTNAFTALNALIDANDGDNWAARAHYFLGDMYTQRQQYENALAHLRAYRDRSGALIGIIDQEIGDVLRASGDSAAALEQYGVALQDQSLPPSRRVTILSKMAEVHRERNEPGLAAAKLGEAFTFAPDNKTRASVEYQWGVALQAADETAAANEHWTHALATYTTERGAYDSVVQLVELGVDVNDLQRGIADYYAGKYDVAVQAFRRYIAARETPGAEVVYFAALSYRAQGDLAGALRNFEVVLQSYPQDKRVPDALYGKAMALVGQGKSTDGLTVLRQLAKQYPAYSQTDTGYWQTAESLRKAQQYTRAASIYQELASTFPRSGWSSAALYTAGLSYYFAQDAAQATKAWNQTIANYPASQHADSASYWLGKLAQARGDSVNAQKFFRQAATPPYTYYSWRALDALGEDPAPTTYDLAAYSMAEEPGDIAQVEQWLASWSGASANAGALPPAVLNDPNFRRGNEFATLDQVLEARPEFTVVNDRFKENAQALYALARYYRDINYYWSSIDAAERLARLSGQAETQLPRPLRQLMYPTYFADLIVPYAQQHGFDPALFMGLVRQESRFYPLSYSSAAARGLTQVIPGTGDLIAKSLKVQDFEQDDLFKPYVSVRFGTYFLAIVLDQFDGNPFYALMGYNGGPGNARKWERADLDLAVENITLPESHLYVRTVYSQYRQYVDIYRGKAE